eukprot:g36679.t1
MIVGVAGIPGALVWHLATYQRKMFFLACSVVAILRVVTVVGFTAGRDAQLNSFGSVFSARPQCTLEGADSLAGYRVR